MGKKIGKNIQILFFLCINFIGFLHSNVASVSLSFLDIEHNPIRQAEVGVPFVLQVTACNMQESQLPNLIQGFENFHVTQHGSSHSVRMINGITTEQKTFNYVLRTDKKGTYHIGPVKITGTGNTFAVSERLSIDVGDKTITQKSRQRQYFLQVEVPKKEIYIGEKINFTIRFYYIDAFENMKIIHPEIENFYIETVSEHPKDGEEKIDDMLYKYKEWTMTLYPEVSGLHVIPQMQAAFKAASMHVFDFFNFNSERIVQSAPRSIQVKSLPELQNHEKISAVGKFIHTEFQLQHTQGDVGEGIVATYIVVGQGNVSYMKAPSLQLPAGLIYYESNSSIKKLVDGNFEKSFEYIIQGERVGSYEIQPQEFIYFDPKKEKYEILHTNKIALQIVGEAIEKKESKLDKNSTEKHQKYVFNEEQINYIQEIGFVSEDFEHNVLQSLLEYLLRIVAFISFLAAMYWIYMLKFLKVIDNSYYILYLRTLMAGYWAYYKKDLNSLYEILLSLCKKYEFNNLQQEDLKAVISQFSHKKVADWDNFMFDIMAELFSQEKISVEKKKTIMEAAMYWIKELLYCFKQLKKRQKSAAS